jgi:hypothetical protein
MANKEMGVEIEGEFFAAVRANAWWSYVGWAHYEPSIKAWILRDSINTFRHPVNGDTGGILGVAEEGLTPEVEWRMSPGIIIMPEASIAFIAPCRDKAYQSIRKGMK